MRPPSSSSLSSSSLLLSSSLFYSSKKLLTVISGICGDGSCRSVFSNRRFFFPLTRTPTTTISTTTTIRTMTTKIKNTTTATTTTDYDEDDYSFPPNDIPTVPVTRYPMINKKTMKMMISSRSSKTTKDDNNSSRTTTTMLQRFPVHRIYCVGRNYAEHSIEMGGNPQREEPFFFTKPSDAVVFCGVDTVDTDNDEDDKSKSSTTNTRTTTTIISYPSCTNNLHHEVELVIAIGREGSNIAIDDALQYVYGYAVGVDLTRRDIQKIAKEQRRPWDSSKAFDHSAPIGTIYQAVAADDDDADDRNKDNNNNDIMIWLDVNGYRKQTGCISDMIWSIEEIISTLSKQFHLLPGDLIYTGTPSGVDTIKPGDIITAGIGSLQTITFQVQ